MTVESSAFPSLLSTKAYIYRRAIDPPDIKKKKQKKMRKVATQKDPDKWQRSGWPECVDTQSVCSELHPEKAVGSGSNSPDLG